ncbi:hypothetical protein M5K25_011059 [Dendrobium thyrsiflorum]|uniref:Uncharacterized protein n=1 Tax=Dendrobium thyrsiflorum TaxID=117978 RepID=A0ABD0V2V5_DENTH
MDSQITQQTDVPTHDAKESTDGESQPSMPRIPEEKFPATNRFELLKIQRHLQLCAKKYNSKNLQLQSEFEREMKIIRRIFWLFRFRPAFGLLGCLAPVAGRTFLGVCSTPSCSNSAALGSLAARKPVLVDVATMKLSRPSIPRQEPHIVLRRDKVKQCNNTNALPGAYTSQKSLNELPLSRVGVQLPFTITPPNKNKLWQLYLLGHESESSPSPACQLIKQSDLNNTAICGGSISAANGSYLEAAATGSGLLGEIEQGRDQAIWSFKQPTCSPLKSGSGLSCRIPVHGN